MRATTTLQELARSLRISPYKNGCLWIDLPICICVRDFITQVALLFIWILISHVTWYVHASVDRLSIMRINHHNQQLFRSINILFPIIIIGTSPPVRWSIRLSLIYICTYTGPTCQMLSQHHDDCDTSHSFFWHCWHLFMVLRYMMHHVCGPFEPLVFKVH